jgi:hypothetical protein
MARRKYLIKQVLNLWNLQEKELRDHSKKYYFIYESSKRVYIKDFLNRSLKSILSSPKKSKNKENQRSFFFTEAEDPLPKEGLLSLFTRQVIQNFIRLSQKDLRNSLKARSLSKSRK